MDELFEPRCFQSQISESLCELAAQIEGTENPQSITLLHKAMEALLYTISPPKGDVVGLVKGGKKA